MDKVRRRSTSTVGDDRKFNSRQSTGEMATWETTDVTRRNNTAAIAERGATASRACLMSHVPLQSLSVTVVGRRIVYNWP